MWRCTLNEAPDHTNKNIIVYICSTLLYTLLTVYGPCAFRYGATARSSISIHQKPHEPHRAVPCRCRYHIMITSGVGARAIHKYYNNVGTEDRSNRNSNAVALFVVIRA
jgi:hypothetical protein